MYNQSNQGIGLDIGKSLIGAGASYLSTREQSRTARRNTDKTIAANRAMAEYQYSKDLEMWRLQNEYNTPQAQMSRLKDAGLNPHLMYGQGDVGNAKQMPQYHAPRMDYAYEPEVNHLEMLSSFLNLKRQSAEIDNIQAQTEKTKYDADIAYWMSHIRGLEFGMTTEKRAREGKYHDIFMADNKGIEARVKAEIAGWTNKEQILAGQQLKNAYQVELNRLIKQGLAPGDDFKLRIGLSILNALGVNITEFSRKLDSAKPRQQIERNKKDEIPEDWKKFQ